MNRQSLDPLLHFLAVKSISTQDEFLPEIEKARHFLIDTFTNLGFETKILPGIKHAAVFAQKITDPKLPTVLVYGHYDVQPPDPLDQWETPPFEPTIKDRKIYARGATDDKGQLMIHIMATKGLIERYGNNLPINLKFIIEGEEEIGSISVGSLVKKYKDLLKCDYIIVSDGEMPKKGQPAIDINLRGLVYAEISLQSAKQDLHSGQFGGVAQNPAIVLANLISQLKDRHNRITIPKFYEDVVPPSRKDLKDFTSLKISKKQLMTEGNMFGVGGGEEWYSLNERRWSRPTMDINGLTSGYQGEGSKTIIPAKASAKISFRLVPNQNPDQIYANFRKFIQKLTPRNVRLEIIKHASALPYKAPTGHPVFEITKKSLKQTFGKEAVFQGVGGSIGFVPVTVSVLKVPCLMIGFGLPDENLHSPNECFSLDNYDKGIQSMIRLYEQLNIQPLLKT